jgi:DNA topoisomerase-1
MFALKSQAQVMESTAAKSGLRYVHAHESGFTRKKSGKGFVYINGDHQVIREANVLRRIRTLAIPPAWKEVWICRFANGHIQATGKDARGRKQYRYHTEWMRVRNESKFSKLKTFGDCLPKIRAKLRRDLQLPGWPKEKILAAAVLVMELTRMRVGNEEYTEANSTYGLTTIRSRHAQVHGATVEFTYRGKSGIRHHVSFMDPRLSRIIRKCQELPGEELFTYQDQDGRSHEIGSSDVNDYLRRVSGHDITAKDFRTWEGSVHAVRSIVKLGPPVQASKTAYQRREMSVLREAASHLRNTVSVCRKYYVFPELFRADREGRLHRIFKRHANLRRNLDAAERTLLKLLST